MASRVLCIVQVAYFKAKVLFFSFEFTQVQDDLHYILQAYYPDRGITDLRETPLRQVRHEQQRAILDLFEYTGCGPAERAALRKRAAAAARISPKPIYMAWNAAQMQPSA